MIRWLRWLSPTIRELEQRIMVAEAREMAARERADALQTELNAVNRGVIDGLARQMGSKGFFDRIEEDARPAEPPPTRQGYELAARADAEFFRSLNQ